MRRTSSTFCWAIESDRYFHDAAAAHVAPLARAMVAPADLDRTGAMRQEERTQRSARIAPPAGADQSRRVDGKDGALRPEACALDESRRAQRRVGVAGEPQLGVGVPPEQGANFLVG